MTRNNSGKFAELYRFTLPYGFATPPPMTHYVALWIAGVILALLLADQLWLGWDIPLVVGRQLVVLVEWMAFWR